MTSHLRVTIDDIDLVLTEDTSISIELKNPYLNDGIDTYTYSFDVPLDGNRELLGDIDAVQSDIRLTSIEGKPMQIFIDGVLFCHGKVGTVDDQLIDGKVSISLTSQKKQINDMIGDLNLRDLVFPDSDYDALLIGETIGDISAKADSESRYGYDAQFLGYIHAGAFSGSIGFHVNEGDVVKIDNNFTNVIQLQALGFSQPRIFRTVDGITASGKTWDKNLINTSAAYNENIVMRDGDGNGDGSTRRALYHNSRVCYTHHDLDVDGKSADTVIIDQDAYGPYFVLEADRPQSGICFYLLYVLEVLFKHYLNIDYDRNYIGQLVPDFRRLSFFTTLCKYDLKRRGDRADGNPHFPYSSDLKAMNSWLSARGTHGRLEAGREKRSAESDSGESLTIGFYDTVYACQYRLNGDEYEDLSGEFVPNEEAVRPFFLFGKRSERRLRPVRQGDNYDFNIVFYDSDIADERVQLKCQQLRISEGSDTYAYCGYVMDMIANADNLPDMTAKSLLDSLWGSFGLRFYYDTESNHLEPYFIRDILRSQEAPVSIYGRIYDEHKMSERITGVTMKYSAEKDRKEQLGDVRRGITDYDTRYDYLTEKTPPKNIVSGLPYSVFCRGTLSAGDMHLYVDKGTGNCYRVKINKEKLSAGEMQTLQPSMFQVAQNKGITVYDDAYKDLTEEQLAEQDIANNVHQLVSEFEPLEQNDLYANRAKESALLSPFVGEDMWNEHAGMNHIRNVVDSNSVFTFYIDEVLETDERYDVTNSDDGNSPLQSIDWGATITLMRGGGADSHLRHFNRGYDHFDNEQYRIISGQYTLDSDSVSIYGVPYDYNTGDVDGDGGEERISLKIRAYKQDADGNELIADNATPDVKLRGLADKFMSEYIYFLLHRKKVQIKMLCEISYLINVPWKRRFQIGDNIGWIDQISVKVSVSKGIEDVEFTMFEL